MCMFSFVFKTTKEKRRFVENQYYQISNDTLVKKIMLES